nr:reverse transcriptase domain-containing protein [Tanacetum cinerariifolium]
MMTTDQFFRLEKDNPHDHICWFNKITSSIKFKDVPNSVIKLMLFPFSLARVAHRWLEKEPSRSIHTWEDLVSKFINEFFPPSRSTNLRKEISNFQQRFDESFHEAWDRYKDLLRACPYHGFTELHQLDTFYNALNPADQDSFIAAAGGNLLERCTQDVLTIIENKSKVHNSRNKSVVSQVKSFDANSNSSSEIAKLTHAVNQQTSAVTTAMMAILKQFQATPHPASIKAVDETCVTCGAAVNYNQRNSGYRPLVQSYQAPTQQNQIVPFNELEKVKRMNVANIKAMQSQINRVENDLRNEMKNSIQASRNIVANAKGELKAITPRSGLVIDGPTVPTPPLFINPEEDERVEETLTDPDLIEYTIKVPPPPVQKYKPPYQREYAVHQRDPLHPNIPYPSRMLKQKQQEKDEVQIHKFWQMFKQLHINITLTDALILMPNELKCKALADLGASINLMPLSVWKKLESPFILGRPFLRTARALIDVHGKEMILRDERGNVLPKKLLDLDSTKNLHPPLHVNPLSGITTYSSSSNQLLEEFTDELALITFPLKYDDDLQFDIESDLKEIEFLLHKDRNSRLKDSIDQSNLADNFVDSMTEMFTDEHALDYSSPSIFDEYDDNFLEVEFDAENVYDDPFDSKERKSKSLNS